MNNYTWSITLRLFTTLAPATNTVPTASAQAQNNLNPSQVPFPTMAPASGFPTNVPNPAQSVLIPILVPNIAKLGDSVTTDVGCSDTNVPEKNPYSTQKTMIPGVLAIASQQYARIKAAQVHMAIMFRGPVLSAKKLGRIRPKAEPALRMGTM